MIMMQIDEKRLTHEDVGRWVEYKGEAREVEKGRLKSWNFPFVYVVFNCDEDWEYFMDYTAEACRPKDITFIENEDHSN